MSAHPHPPLPRSAENSPLCDDFCRTHWQHLYHIARQRGCDPQTAQDAVQDLFLSLVRRGILALLSRQPPATQVRFLTIRLRCILINRWRGSTRQRRGGPQATLSLDDEHVPEPAHHDTPASLHDHAWLSGCLTLALTRLRQQTPAPTWQQLQPHLLGEQHAPQPSGAQRVALHRARKKLRRLVREAMNGSFQDWTDHLPRHRRHVA